MNIQQKMRLALCIAVCVAGLLIMGHLFGVEALRSAYAGLEEALGARLILFIAAALMIVFGAAGVRLPMRTPPTERKIVFHSEYGDIEIQLSSVERNIKRVLKKLPEIHKVKVRVYADETQEHAIVEADCVLAQHPDSPDHARQVANRISGYIALMARKTMGLEELATIKVNVVNVHYEGTGPISSILEPPEEPYEPILLEHDEDQLEVVEPAPAASVHEIVEEAQAAARDAEPKAQPGTGAAPADGDEHAAVSEGPMLEDDELGAEFDDFMSIHDASGFTGHEISQAGFEMTPPPVEVHPPDAGAEPDFRLVNMRVKARAEEQAARTTETVSGGGGADEEQDSDGGDDGGEPASGAGDAQAAAGAGDAAKNQAKSKRKRGRKGKRRK